jgi:FlaA1/EpsC-like NDP-sugar epimerase
MERFIKKRLIYILFDLGLVFLSFLSAIALKSGTLSNYLGKYLVSFLVFLAIWLLGSWFFKKYSFRDYDKFNRVIRPILISNFVIAGTVALLMYMTRRDEYPRTIVSLTIIIASFLELVLGLAYHFLRSAKLNDTPTDREYLALKAQGENGNNGFNGNGQTYELHDLSEEMKSTILEECSMDAIKFI